MSRIDQARWYSNHGPLARELEQRLAGTFNLARNQVATAASGTTALIGAILAAAGRANPERPICICPAYTFVATAAAIEQCGYKLHLADVDETDWTLDAAVLHDRGHLDGVGLVVPVSPYGRSPKQADWATFSQVSGIPVVIDAAASFEAVLDDPGRAVGPTPVVLSLHATKAFSTGEGGVILCSDPQRVEGAARALNFGIWGERISRSAGLNGKISEYHAAVGLAGLDDWSQIQDAFARVIGAYADAASAAGLADRVILAPRIASNYVLFAATNSAEATRVCTAVQISGFETRLWYGLGLHREPYFAGVCQDDLPHTEAIAARLIGLPMASDLSAETIQALIGVIERALRPYSAAIG